MIAVVAIAGFFVIGAQHVLNNFTANSYETGFRASGVGMELGVGRVGGILGPFVIGFLQQVTGSQQAVFWAISGAAIVAALVIGSLSVQSKAAEASVAPAEFITISDGSICVLANPICFEAGDEIAS